MSQHKQMDTDELSSLNQILKDTSYKPVAKISYGSFGQIFKIEDSEKEYALKAISKQRMMKQCKIHEAVIEGFVLSRMDHPGVIKYYQTLQTKQYICQVLQYCRFGDLFGLLKRVNKNMELIQRKKQIALYYLAQIIDALAYLHSKGIIHRDLKLQNVVIADDLNSKIVDFGTAKPVKLEQFYTAEQVQFITHLRKKPSEEQQQQQVSNNRKSFVGSANYLSPQSISLQYSLSSDIWSFGILAYKIFHGKLPFEGQNNYEIFKKIRENQISISQKLQPTIHDLICRCLKINAQERPTALQLKSHPYFKNVKFQQIFKMPSPINKQLLLKLYNTAPLGKKSSLSPEKSPRGNVQFEALVEKKMFFGNFKPRIIKVYSRGQSLLMSYWYVDGTSPKNQFELQINDYAQQISKKQFDVHNKDLKYTFKLHNKQNSVATIVASINQLIKKHYQLQ